MSKYSLPITLQLALQQHVAQADIEDDDDLRTILLQLSVLNEKVEAVKMRAIQQRSVP